jgi:hypothetical protein
MRKSLLVVISAVICGILAMLIPLCAWYQVNFPGRPFTFSGLKEGASGSLDSYEISLKDLSMTPFYVAFVLSFAVSMVVYIFSKRRV